MLAMLMAMNIVRGTYTYERVPKYLKKAVKEQLEIMDAGHLAVEE